MTRHHLGPPAAVLAPVALVAAILTGGCGSADSGAPAADGSIAATSGAGAATTRQDAPAALPDPCSLLTTAEIAAASTLEFGAGTPSTVITGEDRAACDWVSTGSTFATAQVLLWRTSAGSYDDARSGMTDALGTDVSDITIPGTRHAFTVTGGTIIGMDMGGLYLQVSFLPSSNEDVLTTTTGLATRAAGRVT
jgi:hypothetical protein